MFSALIVFVNQQWSHKSKKISQLAENRHTPPCDYSLVKSPVTNRVEKHSTQELFGEALKSTEKKSL